MIYYLIKQDIKYRGIKQNQIFTQSEIKSYGLENSDYAEMISLPKSAIEFKQNKRFIKNNERVVKL